MKYAKGTPERERLDRAWVLVAPVTHWEGCEDGNHLRCALARVLDALDERDAEIQRLRELLREADRLILRAVASEDGLDGADASTFMSRARTDPKGGTR